ncbi:MAG: hypothetical protein LBD38_04185, partial [Streptococcaceae bacterium]|nr:hypothetical protein [Streptococcaceae bacterium]
FLIKFVRLFIGDRKTAPWISLAGFSLFITSPTFKFGGSPEEFSVPFLLGLIYLISKRVKSNQEFSMPDSFFQAMSLAFLFWLKYSLIGAWVGFFLYIGVNLIVKKEFLLLVKTVLAGLSGFLIITLPILLYFWTKNALWNLFHVYFSVNLSSYSGNTKGFEKLIAIIQAASKNFAPHIFETALLLIIAIILIFHPHIKRRWKTLAILVFGGELFFVYASTHPYYYYFLPFSSFLAVIVCLLILYAGRRMQLEPLKSRLLQILISMVIIGSNVYAISVPTTIEDITYERSSKVTSNVVKKMKEISKGDEITLLQIGSIDAGYYLQTNTLPQGMYFENPNIPYENFPEIINSQLEMVRKQSIVFVIYTPVNRAFRGYLNEKPKEVDLLAVKDTPVRIPKILLKNYKLVYSTFQKHHRQPTLLFERKTNDL